MATIKKDNQVLRVDDAHVVTFLRQGFDQVEVDKATKRYKIVKRATGGRAVSLAVYNKTVEALEAATAKLATFDSIKEQLAARDSEIKSLKAQVLNRDAQIAKLKK